MPVTATAIGPLGARSVAPSLALAVGVTGAAETACAFWRPRRALAPAGVALAASVDSGVAVGGAVRRRRAVVLDGASPPPPTSSPLGLVVVAGGGSAAASAVARLRPRRPAAGAGVVGPASGGAFGGGGGGGGGGRSGSAPIVDGVRKCGAPICLPQKGQRGGMTGAGEDRPLSALHAL